MKDLERICRAVITDIFDGVDWRYANTYERKIVRAAVRGVLKAIRDVDASKLDIREHTDDGDGWCSQWQIDRVIEGFVDHLLED